MPRDPTVLHPGFAARPYWWEAAPPDDGRGDGRAAPERVDVAVVGGGYCGLAAALELARAGTAVAVLEANELGFGASTRNGGLVSGGPTFGKKGVVERFGARKAAEMMAEAGQSFVHLETLLAREGLDADYRRCGRFVGAWTDGHYRELERRAGVLREQAGNEVYMVPRARQREEIGSDFYRGGMVVENAGALHPAKYHRSLREAAARAGAGLFARAGVRAITRDGDRGFVLDTARGRVAAREVVVATNGYTGPATPELRRRLIPVASYIVATEELPEGLVRELSPKGRVFADTKRVLYYFRPSPDGRRILFGGRASFRDADERASAPRLHGFMRRVWPQLAEARITHAWKGNVAFAFDHVPHMGTLEGGLHYALGCQGSGVAMMTWLGHRTALKILGRRNRPCAFDGLPFPTRPFYTGWPWFLPVVGTWYRLRDRLERPRAA